MSEASDTTTVTAGTLLVDDVVKRFGGVNAVDHVSLHVGQRETVGLIGPNGAGKTTLLNMIAGVQRPDSGHIYLDGVALGAGGPREAAHAGIGRTFQNIRLFRRLTVRQNVEVAEAGRSKELSTEAAPRPDEVLSRFGLLGLADVKAGELPYGHQRRLEIARALMLRPRFLLLDEPAAGMNDGESAQLSHDLVAVGRTEQCGVVVIDHDLPFIMSLCDRIYVLHDGALIAEGTPSEVRADENVQRVYLGRRRGRSGAETRRDESSEPDGGQSTGDESDNG